MILIHDTLRPILACDSVEIIFRQLDDCQKLDSMQKWNMRILNCFSSVITPFAIKTGIQSQMKFDPFFWTFLFK